jgi:hypothetical protein
MSESLKVQKLDSEQAFGVPREGDQGAVEFNAIRAALFRYRAIFGGGRADLIR